MYLYIIIVLIISLIQWVDLLVFLGAIRGENFHTTFNTLTLLQNIVLIIFLVTLGCTLIYQLKYKYHLEYKIQSSFIIPFMITETGCLIFQYVGRLDSANNVQQAYQIYLTTSIRSGILAIVFLYAKKARDPFQGI